MNSFMSFLAEKVLDFPMHVEITYCKTTDWTIYIYKNGCANKYPGTKSSGDDAIIVYEQDGDFELCCAKAHVALKNWLSDHCGGY